MKNVLYMEKIKPHFIFFTLDLQRLWHRGWNRSKRCRWRRICWSVHPQLYWEADSRNVLQAGRAIIRGFSFKNKFDKVDSVFISCSVRQFFRDYRSTTNMLQGKLMKSVWKVITKKSLFWKKLKKSIFGIIVLFMYKSQNA